MSHVKRRWLACLFLIPLALGGSGEPAEPGISPGASDRWHVYVSGPRGDDGRIEHCLDDDAVDESIQTADLPSTNLSIKLHTSATEEDAKRIAGCLNQNLDSGEVSISSPAG